MQKAAGLITDAVGGYGPEELERAGAGTGVRKSCWPAQAYDENR